jgi:hypothetical protein
MPPKKLNGKEVPKKPALKGNKNASKKALPIGYKSKPEKPKHTIIAITRKINDRINFISGLGTTGAGTRFIPVYSTDRKQAKDFLTVRLANDHLAMMHPGVGSDHIIEAIQIDVNHAHHPDPETDGPNYELSTITILTDDTE